MFLKSVDTIPLYKPYNLASLQIAFVLSIGPLNFLLLLSSCNYHTINTYRMILLSSQGVSIKETQKPANIPAAKANY